MKRWKGLALCALAMLLMAAQPAQAAEETASAMRMTTADIKAARAEARAQAQADRAAAKQAQKQERAAALETRKAAREAQKQERAAVKAEQSAARVAEKQALREARVATKMEKKAAKEQQKRERAARYKTLFTDNNFTYYLDVKNTRWVPRPYQSSEYMIDAWVRLVENTTGEAVAEDGKIRSAKYFLEHYYISPQRHQIMFISELEVTGRPENAVKERAYDPKNWEQLVPGSIEDALYEKITARMKSPSGQRGGLLGGTSGMSLRDVVEEYARISL
jgi:hypothetical protein